MEEDEECVGVGVGGVQSLPSFSRHVGNRSSVGRSSPMPQFDLIG